MKEIAKGQTRLPENNNQTRSANGDSSNETPGNDLPKLLKALIVRLEKCKDSKEALALLDKAQGGSQGLQYNDGVYQLDDYSIFYIFGPAKSNAKICLEKASELELDSVPKLIKQIPLNEQGQIVITHLKNKPDLVNYDEANKAGFVDATSKNSFIEDLAKLYDKGIDLEILLDSACTNLSFDKQESRIVFDNLSHANFNSAPDQAKKEAILQEIKGYLQ